MLTTESPFHFLVTYVLHDTIMVIQSSKVLPAGTLGSTVHHVSVPGSVADTHKVNKIDIKNHTFIDNEKTHYKIHII
jgi:hypothetical protein